MTDAERRRLERLEQLVRELLRKLENAERKAGRNAQTIRFIPGGG